MLDLKRPPTAPGEMLLEEFLRPSGLTQVEAARRMGVPLNRLNEIVRGKRGITADTALRLGAAVPDVARVLDGPAGGLGSLARGTHPPAGGVATKAARRPPSGPRTPSTWPTTLQCLNRCPVPEISRFFGIVIRMFMEAGAPHHTPHFHAYYQGFVAVFSVAPVELVAGELPRTQRRLVEAWAELHQPELLADWERLQSGRPPVPIPPLQ